MKNQNNLTMSKQDLARTQVVEFGKILFNLQIVLAIVFASPLPVAVYPLYYGALVIVSVFTGFVAFLAPNFLALWNPAPIYNATTAILEAWKYSVPIVIAVSLLSILCLSLDKDIKHKKRIIASIVIIVLVTIYFIFRLSIVNYGGAA